MLVTLLQALLLVHTAESVVFEPGVRLVTGCRDRHLKIWSYKWCMPALKRGKWFANFWKTGKYLKAINESGLRFFFLLFLFFPCRRKAL